MSVRILEGFKINDGQQGSVAAAMYCGTSGVAFGPLFRNGDEAESFLKWSINRGIDVRNESVGNLIDFVEEFEIATGRKPPRPSAL